MGLFISTAYANDAAAPAGMGFETIIMLVLFAAVFYFMIFRPQNKRVKEHKDLMSSLGKGDEVLTSGGVIGKIVKIAEDHDYVELAINDNSEIVIKKDFVTAMVPKGTMKSLK